LQADALKSRGPEDAFIYAQTLEGIGPFYASLIVLRATGFADAPLRIPEPRTLNYAAELYDAQQLSLERLTQLAENWRPFRTWSTVLIRIAAAHAKAQQHVTPSKKRAHLTRFSARLTVMHHRLEASRIGCPLRITFRDPHMEAVWDRPRLKS